MIKAMMLFKVGCRQYNTCHVSLTCHLLILSGRAPVVVLQQGRDRRSQPVQGRIPEENCGPLSLGTAGTDNVFNYFPVPVP